MKNKQQFRTSEVLATPSYTNIGQDFDIFKVSLVKDKDANRKEKHVGGHILDLLDQKYHARSILYLYGEEMFCLYDKNRITVEQLKIELESNSSINLTVQLVDPRFDLFESQLIQLLCNSLPNMDDTKYNNLSGKLFVLKEDSIRKRKTGGKTVSSLEIKISPYKKRYPYCNINISVATFNSLADVLSYNSKEKDKEKISKLPKYIIDSEGNFRRKLKKESYSNNDIFVQRNVFKTEKNLEPFLSFDDLTSFKNSKMGVLYEFLNDVEYYLGKYVSFEFNTVTKFEKVENYSQNQLFKKEKDYFEKINEKGICVVNMVGENEEANLVLERILGTLNDLGIINVLFDTKIDSNKVNLLLIHSKDYYSQNELKDPYHETRKYQHLVLEEYIKTNKTGDMKATISQEAIRKVLYEIFIREDINNGELSLFNWDSFDFGSKVNYALVKQYTDDTTNRKEFEFHILSVTPDAKISYLVANKERNVKDYDMLMKHVNNFVAEYLFKNDLKMIIYTNEDVVLLIDNGVITIPDVGEIYKRLSLYSKDKRISKNQLLRIITRFVAKFPDYGAAFVQIKDGIYSDNKNEYTYEEVINAQYSEKAVAPLIRLSGNMAYEFIEYAFNEYQILFNPIFKNQRTSNLIGNSATKIKLFKHPIDKLDNSIYYFVGFKGSIKDFQLSRATHIRQLKPLLNSKGENNLIGKIVEQLNVDFVRLGEFTVYPFPMKYLNEVIRLTSKEE